MGSKSILLILIIGIVGLAAFGMATKVALDGNDELKSIAKLKSGLIESFGDRGVEVVSYRLQRKPRAVRLLVTVSGQSVVDDALEDELARYYLEFFPKSAGISRLEFFEPKSWGFGSPEAFRVRDIPLREFQRRERERLALIELREVAAEIHPGVEVVDVVRESRVLLLRVLAPQEIDSKELISRIAEECVRRARPDRKTKVCIERVLRETTPGAGKTEIPTESIRPVESIPGSGAASPGSGAASPGSGAASPGSGAEPVSGKLRVVDTAWFDFRGRPASPGRRDKSAR